MKNSKYNKIVIIGKSQKFIKEIKKNYTFKKLDIIPWRQIQFYLNKQVIKYNLVFNANTEIKKLNNIKSNKALIEIENIK